MLERQCRKQQHGCCMLACAVRRSSWAEVQDPTGASMQQQAPCVHRAHAGANTVNQHTGDKQHPAESALLSQRGDLSAVPQERHAPPPQTPSLLTHTPLNPQPCDRALFPPSLHLQLPVQ
jgi:hypothetical protein